MSEPRYCLNAGCRKFGTCQMSDNCLLTTPDRVQKAKADAAFSASVSVSARNARRLEEAQQKIVSQQARIEQLRGYACSCNRSSDLLSLPCMVHDRPEMDDLSALAAHDAELTAKAKAEALEEARAGIDTIDDGEQPAYRHCQEFLGEKAAEYRAKAKG